MFPTRDKVPFNGTRSELMVIKVSSPSFEY